MSEVAWGSVEQARTMKPLPRGYGKNRKCPCGCKQKITHTGFGGHVALTNGCELYIRRWVRDGSQVRRSPEQT